MSEPADQQTEVMRKHRIWKTTWRGWLRFAEVVAMVQMMIILTIVYWIFIAAAAVPFGIIPDPLGLRRRPGGARWSLRNPPADSLEYMRKQW